MSLALIIISVLFVLSTILIGFLARWAVKKHILRGYLVGVFIFTAILFGLLLRPVCVPVSAESLKDFNVPIEQREDRDFYLKVFQKKNGE